METQVIDLAGIDKKIAEERAKAVKNKRKTKTIGFRFSEAKDADGYAVFTKLTNHLGSEKYAKILLVEVAKEYCKKHGIN